MLRNFQLEQLQNSKERILQDLQELKEKYENKEEKIIKEIKYCDILKRYFKNNVQKFKEYIIILKIIDKNLNSNILKMKKVNERIEKIKKQIEEIQKELELINIHKEEVRKKENLQNVSLKKELNKKSKALYEKKHKINTKVIAKENVICKSEKKGIINNKRNKVKKIQATILNNNFNMLQHKDMHERINHDSESISETSKSIYEKAYQDMIRRNGNFREWIEKSNNSDGDYYSNCINKNNLIDKLKIYSIKLQGYKDQALGEKIIQINNRKYILNRKLSKETKKEVNEICKKIFKDTKNINLLKKIILIYKIKARIDPAIINGVKDYFMHITKKCDKYNEIYLNMKQEINLEKNVEIKKLKTAYQNSIKAKIVKEQCIKSYKESLKDYINLFKFNKAQKQINTPFKISYDYSKNKNISEYNIIKEYINIAKKIGSEIIENHKMQKNLRENFRKNNFISEDNYRDVKYIEGDKSFIKKISVKPINSPKKSYISNQNKMSMVSNRQISNY